MYARPRSIPSPRSVPLISWKSPTAGLIANRNMSVPQGQDGRQPPGAEVLENWFPTARGVVLRRGSEVYATLEDGEAPEDRPDVREHFTYNFGGTEKLFAVTDTAIYDLAIPSVPVKVFDGLSPGEWSYTQFATSGGTFLIAVNGVDPMMLYDGNFWYPVRDTNLYTLSYDNATDPFTVGSTVTGGTSGATGTIRNVYETSATAGTLIIDDLSGNFDDNETITDGGGGSADADGAEVIAFAGITGISTSALSYVWSFKSRLYFAERTSLNAWYLPVDSIGGAATVFPLGGVFTLGGSLLFGSSWSVESADGLDARCVFVTDGGEEGAEIAVYAGSNPSDPDLWYLLGVYRTGKPLGKTAHVRAGGDVVIATDLGFIPLSVSIQRDIAALAPSALSFAIEDDWAREVAIRGSSPWKCKIWPTGRMLVIALPTVPDTQPKWYVANVRTGAWCTFTGWDAQCIAVYDDRLFFGSTQGRIVEANVTGYDQGEVYSATCVPLFDDFGSPASLKIPGVARTVIRSPVDVDVLTTMQFDFMVDLPPSPPAASLQLGDTWGTGVWDISTWGEEPQGRIVQKWVSVGGMGYALAPSVQVSSGSNDPIDAELVRIEATYKEADVIS